MGLPINLLWTNNELNLPMPKKDMMLMLTNVNITKNLF